MGLAVGSATINDTIYNQVALRPELSFGKLGIGLDLVMYIDNEGNVRKVVSVSLNIRVKGSGDDKEA